MTCKKGITDKKSVMNEDNGPTYDELRTKCDDLQKQVAHSLVVEQDLINIRDSLDRDLTRFTTIQSYNQKAIRSDSLQDFAEITAEAIIEAFEVECSAMLMYDKTNNMLMPLEVFGIEKGLKVKYQLDMDWITAKELLTGGKAFIEQIRPGIEPWHSLGLSQVIICPFYDNDGGLQGLLIGGISTEKKAYYGKMTEELIPSFVVFTQQMSSLLHNLHSQEVIRGQVMALSQANIELSEKTQRLQAAKKELEEINRNLKRMVNELSSLHTIGTAITSIFNTDQLLDIVLKTVVQDLGYDRAMIMLVDRQKNVLRNGKSVGGTEEMGKFVDTLEIPIKEGDGGLSRVVISGEPILVVDVESNDEKLNVDIMTALKTKSFLAVPLKTGEKVIGVMVVDNFRSGIRLTQNDESLLSTLASQVSISLENAKLVQQVTTSERLSAIGEMAAGIAHEIRNPLTSIGTLVDILENQTKGGDPLLFTGIKEEFRRLQDIITRFLNYAKPYTPERSPSNVNLLLEEVVSLLENDESHPGVVIERHFHGTIGSLSIDCDNIKQVFWNVILNGLQAMTGGGTLTVCSRDLGDRVEVEVLDEGPGICQEDLNRIFEPFYTTKDKGTGLGLPIAEKIIKAHGGTMTVESELGYGTKVTLNLPKSISSDCFLE